MSNAPLPAAGPQLIREYARAQDFHRQAIDLSRAGWRPVTVTLTGVPFVPRALNVLSFGLLSHLAPVEPSLLVTYSTDPALPEAA